MPDTGLLLIISGPSGVGKTTIVRAVEKKLDCQFSVSLTTRPQAAGEVDGVDYTFTDNADFERRIRRGELLEYARVFDHYYGTPRRPADRALARGRLFLLDIDVQGAVQVKRNRPDALAIFILPPAEPELLRRLQARAREHPDVIERRFAKARAEIQAAHDSGVYDHFVVNDQLDRAIEQTLNIIQAERRARLAP